jgi:hypothetical protein
MHLTSTNGSDWQPGAVHEVSWTYSSVADRGVLECRCGWRQVFSDYDYPNAEAMREAVQKASKEHSGNEG